MDQMQWQMLQQALQSGAMGGAGGMMGRAPVRMAPQMQEQQVPPGNPIADYYQGRANNLGALAKTSAVGSGIAGGMGLSELMDMSPWALPLLLGAGGAAAYGGKAVQDQQALQGAADMWHNRFGNGDPNQGMPGTPSGPAYRR